jgi:hypothetical protein
MSHHVAWCTQYRLESVEDDVLVRKELDGSSSADARLNRQGLEHGGSKPHWLFAFAWEGRGKEMQRRRRRMREGAGDWEGSGRGEREGRRQMRGWQDSRT